MAPGSLRVRCALVLAVVSLALGCGEATTADKPGRNQLPTAPSDRDYGPEVVDDVLYPPGIPLQSVTSSVGVSRTGYVVTSNAGECGQVDVYDADGRLLTSDRCLIGIALTHPTSDIAAWTAAKDPEERRRLVLVDTRTGEKLHIGRFDSNPSVQGVYRDEVAIENGSDSLLLTADGATQRLELPDDTGLWGFDSERIVYGGLDETYVARRSDGDVTSIETSIGASFPVLDPGRARVALLDANSVSVLDLDLGAVTRLPVKSPLWMWWTARGDLVVETGDPSDDAAESTLVVCLDGSRDCRLLESEHPGRREWLHPNNSLGNFFTQLD